MKVSLGLIITCLFFLVALIIGTYILISIIIYTCIINNSRKKLRIYLVIALYIAVLSFNIEFIFGLLIEILPLFNVSFDYTVYFNIVLYSGYIIGRYGLVLLFIGKLYYSFNGSAVQISWKKFIILITFESIGILSFIVACVLFYLDHETISVLPVLILAVMTTITDIIINIIMVVIYIRRLKLMTIHSNITQKSDDIYRKLIRKYTLLVCIKVTTTFIQL